MNTELSGKGEGKIAVPPLSAMSRVRLPVAPGTGLLFGFFSDRKFSGIKFSEKPVFFGKIRFFYI